MPLSKQAQELEALEKKVPRLERELASAIGHLIGAQNGASVALDTTRVIDTRPERTKDELRQQVFQFYTLAYQRGKELEKLRAKNEREIDARKAQEAELKELRRKKRQFDDLEAKRQEVQAEVDRAVSSLEVLKSLWQTLYGASYDVVNDLTRIYREMS